ncbi:MAG: cardiolipin synthase [Bacteroidota bacterium]|nr:MAG: phospholipase D/transphosphatidylase [Bacteroidetes bacterium OLB12]GIL23450.1 MAG: cardiolipin synthase [Bacteroidota bacterium]HNR73370.1 cardiolipin synthase [Cyclobacteriaceae bacterium]
MNWILIIEIIYAVILGLVCLRIIYDTNSVVKTLAYLIIALVVPVAGILFYFSVGINYRKRKIYSKKIVRDGALRKQLESQILIRTNENLKKYSDRISYSDGLVKLLVQDSLSPLTNGNRIKILLNGEEKFPELLAALKEARHHIHIQYYIYENDTIGNTIKDLLIEKARQGIKVRFIYDDFGSSTVRGKLVNELRSAGVEAYPFNRIYLLLLANRLNYRNHRRIVIIDGQTAFTGGINVSDRYLNTEKQPRYWRDTHVRVDGPGCQYLQYLFLCDWNFSSGQQVEPNLNYFNTVHQDSDAFVQIAASGPDSPTATIMLSYLKAIAIARESIMITTPYFIPGDSILDALRIAAMSGVSVSLLVPGTSDSWWVNMAARSYYSDLLKAGVKIYLYRKGFVHAKTMVVDSHLSIIGTANMDYRSFDLNFEVNAILYDEACTTTLRKAFETDVANSEKIELQQWEKRKLYKQLSERIARLLSPLM